MKFSKKIRMKRPRKVKKRIIKSRGRFFYFMITSVEVANIMSRPDRRILPSLLTIDTNPNSEKVFKWSFNK